MHYLVFITFLIFSTSVFSGYKSQISFTNQEVKVHKEKIHVFVNIASQCLEDYKTEHLDFYRKNCKNVSGKSICLSKFYGERRYSKKKNAYRPDGTPLEFLGSALSKIGFPESYMDQMEANSCVGMTLQCLKESFYTTDQITVWNKVLQFTKDNGVGGTALQHALSLLGWKTYYWNPAPLSSIVSDMKRWDNEEINWGSKGDHLYRYTKVINNGTYWFNSVDNHTDLVGFGSTEPEILKDFPFWVGTAHTGYHVFPGSFGDVVEAHSTRPITAIDNLEFSRFSPFAIGGGPKWTKTEKYRSGLIVLPPIN